MGPPGTDPPTPAPTSAPVAAVITPRPTHAPVAHVETSKPSPNPTSKPVYSKGKGAIPVAKGKGAYVISKGKGGQVPVKKIYLVPGKSGKKHKKSGGFNKYGFGYGYGYGGLGGKHKKKSGHYPPKHDAPFEFNYHHNYDKYHNHGGPEVEMPKEPYQNPNWDGALIVGVDSMIEPPLPSQQKRVDAPPRKPIPQPLTSINSVQQKVVESPPRKPLPQPLASIDSAQQKMAAGEEASQEKIAAALYKKIAEVPNRTPLPTALHESSGVEEPLPDIDTAQQKIVEEAPPRKPLPSTVATDTAQQGVIVDDFPMMEQPLPVTANTETLEAPPRKPQPVSAGDSSAMDQNQKIIEEAQKLVEESTARDPSMEEDRADGTEQIKNWFLS